MRGRASGIRLSWILQRFSADGTAGAAVTPVALDFNVPVAISTSGENYSAEPTYTANEILLNIRANQRATQRWVASPGGELMIPALAGDGLGMQPSHASHTGDVVATFHFEE